MDLKRMNTKSHDNPANLRWLLLALAAIGTHQVQSLVQEPEERTFRIISLLIIALTPATLLLPSRWRGGLWMLLGALPTFGAFIGHLIPIVRDDRVPPASETAPLNLAGGTFLLTLGAAQAFGPEE